jgi:hypothetical protein
MKKAAFLTAWIIALAITCTFAQSGGGTGKGSDTTRIHKNSSAKHTKKAMRKAAIKKTDSIAINKGTATLSDGTDARGAGNNGTGGNGTGNNGNGGVGTGRPSGTGSGSAVKVKP